MDARGAADQQLGGALQAELLHLFGSEGGNPDLRDPDRQLGARRDLRQLIGPLVDHPVVPVERETVHRHRVHLVENALTLHVLDEQRVDRRDAAEHAGQISVLGRHRLPCEARHLGEAGPFRVDLEIPVRLVVGLVPDHHRFDHGSSRALG
jgi:hypothetical protein